MVDNRAAAIFFYKVLGKNAYWHSRQKYGLSFISSGSHGF